MLSRNVRLRLQTKVLSKVAGVWLSSQSGIANNTMIEGKANGRFHVPFTDVESLRISNSQVCLSKVYKFMRSSQTA